MSELEGVGLLRELLTPRTQSDSKAELTVNVVGGNTWLAWISCTCCVVCLTVTIIGSIWLVSDRAEVRDQLRSRQEGENAIRAYINTGRLQSTDQIKDNSNGR